MSQLSNAEIIARYNARDWDCSDGNWPPEFLDSAEEFMDRVAQIPAGEIRTYHEILDTWMFPLQRMAELDKCLDLVSEKIGEPKVVAEIGADKGGGLFHWVKCFPSVQKAIACEIRGCPYRHLFERHFPRVKFLWLEESSYRPEALAKLTGFLGEGPKIDMLFLDGDKARFMTDFETWLPHVRSGGIVFIHDIQDSAPKTAFSHIIDRGYHYSTIIDKSEWEQEGAQREAEGLPIRSKYDGWLRHWKGRSCGVGAILVP